MTLYGAIQNNYFGTYADNPLAFTAEQELNLTTQIAFLKGKSFANYTLVPGVNTPISLGGLPDAQFIVMKADQPVSIFINGNPLALPCDPILILSAANTLNTVTISSVTAMQQSIAGATNCNLYVRMI